VGHPVAGAAARPAVNTSSLNSFLTPTAEYLTKLLNGAKKKIGSFDHETLPALSGIFGKRD